MITKFERKVIAGLTAFLMCLSMVFAVPVSVNAEAEQTQDEAVSDAQQNEDVEDIQIPDSQEDVPHDITVGDEAGTITLKKDGTPEYGEAAFSTEQTTVRYRLNVEEDGQYYFELIRDWSVNAYISIIEKKEDGDTWLPGEESRYELHKGGEYYLEITNNSAESVQTLKWYAGKVRDIKPGEFEAELSENVKEIYYNLTVDETGWYRFDSGSLSMGIKDKETEEFVSAWSFCKLESGHTYYITVSKSEVNPGTSSKWSVKKGKAISVELGQVNRNENSKEVYYVFVPETTGKYTVKEGASVYDENWKTLGIAYSVPLTAGKTYYFTVDRAQYWSIQKYEESEKETIAVQTGTTYTTPFDKNREINYTFTPDTTAIYRFRSQQDNASLSIKECDWQTGFGSSSGKIDFFIALEKGKT